jgi:1,4-dihydroxy-2-naphthoate octaprenyltransferase
MIKSSTPDEPSLANLSNPIFRYFAATRPAFFSATLGACLLGVVGSSFSGVIVKPVLVAVTLLLALLLHAAVNVINDYFDAMSGTDAINTERLYPFTGGSRFIQNGVLSLKQTAYFGYGLLLISILGGLWLVAQVGLGLLFIGLVGVLVGWAYSATPLRLNSRGFGELCVLVGFLGIVVGADFVQRQTFSLQPLIVAMPYALLVTNLLYINQFPDRKADTAAGKYHLVARLPLNKAVLIYPMLAMLAFLWLMVMVLHGLLPLLAMMSALPLLLSARASLVLRKFAATSVYLLPAIKWTIAAMLSHALLLIIILLWEMP